MHYYIIILLLTCTHSLINSAAKAPEALNPMSQSSTPSEQDQLLAAQNTLLREQIAQVVLASTAAKDANTQANAQTKALAAMKVVGTSAGATAAHATPACSNSQPTAIALCRVTERKTEVCYYRVERGDDDWLIKQSAHKFSLTLAHCNCPEPRYGTNNVPCATQKKRIDILNTQLKKFNAKIICCVGLIDIQFDLYDKNDPIRRYTHLGSGTYHLIHYKSPEIVFPNSTDKRTFNHESYIYYLMFDHANDLKKDNDQHLAAYTTYAQKRETPRHCTLCPAAHDKLQARKFFSNHIQGNDDCDINNAFICIS